MSWQALLLRGVLAWHQFREPSPTLERFLASRDEYDQLGRAFGVPHDVRATRFDLGGFEVERLVPSVAEDRTVLYLHGGAYVMGSLPSSRQGACQVGRAGRAQVVNVGYRIAPEHPFPAAVEDAVAAYRWVTDELAPPDRVVVVGSSAGGGLAVAALVAARDAGLAAPAGLVTLSAWADLRCATSSYRRRARRDPSLSPAGLRLAASLYLAGRSSHEPLASPVLADVTGMPPTLALVGTEEILLEDTVALVERLRAAGVPARSLIGRGMVHCWTGYAGQVPEADEALAALGAFIVEHTP